MAARWARGQERRREEGWGNFISRWVTHSLEAVLHTS